MPKMLFLISIQLALGLAGFKLLTYTGEKATTVITPQSTVFVCDRVSDSLALVELFNATNGPNWTNTWDLNQPLDTWYGITLNTSGCVLEIDLNYNGLAGVLPALSFGQLQKLDLGWNNLNGTDLVGFVNASDFAEVRELQLALCAIVSDLPDFSEMPKLELINLEQNYLSGNMPAFLDCPNLIWINLAENSLNGDLPTLAHLTELRFLNLYQNKLEGRIPDFTNATELEYLVLADNRLSGCLPEFSNSPKLNTIIVFDNLLECPIPYYGHLTELTELNVSDNQLTFEDLIPTFESNTTLIQANGGFSYNCVPQKDLTLPSTLSNYEGASITFDLIIDDTVTSNRYQWYKEEELVQEILGNNEWTLENIQLEDAGRYHCVISNPNIPDLILKREEIRVFVYPLPECMGEDLSVDQNPILEGTTWVAADTLKSRGTISQGFEGVNFIAGKAITLLPGFRAPSGSHLRAYIQECSPAEQLVPDNQAMAVFDPATETDHTLSMSIFPNPIRSEASLQYYLPKSVAVQLFISDLSGRVVQTLERNSVKAQGIHVYALDVKHFPAGIYNVHLIAGQENLYGRVSVFK